MPEPRFAITISHHIGCGGSLVGQKLAERLGVPFFDREILHRMSEQLHIAEADLAHRDERLSSFWDNLLRLSALIDPGQVAFVQRYIPSDQELFRLESEMIQRIAEHTSAIFLGRGGRHILRDHPHHLAVLLHAGRPSRIRRVQELYHLSTSDAENLLDTNDRERDAYIRTFAGGDWTDARLYDLSASTSACGTDGAADLAALALQRKFPAPQ
jgi:cytidylate kinase